MTVVDVNDQPTTTARIAGALGDPGGSYQLLIGSRICAALGVDPAFRGHLVASSEISADTVAWLRKASVAAAGAQHAAELLAALQLPSTEIVGDAVAEDKVVQAC